MIIKLVCATRVKKLFFGEGLHITTKTLLSALFFLSGLGVISCYSRPLLIANALTQAPYSRGVTHRSHGTFFSEPLQLHGPQAQALCFVHGAFAGKQKCLGQNSAAGNKMFTLFDFGSF